MQNSRERSSTGAVVTAARNPLDIVTSIPRAREHLRD